GRVVVFIPLDSSFVAWLEKNPQIGSRQELGLARGRSLVGAERTALIGSGRPVRIPSDIRAGGVGYRTVAIRLPAAQRTRLAALEQSSSIEARADSARWRVMGLGLALIAALLALAYAVSPSIARSRVSRQERERAERVLAHVGDGVFLV